MVGFMDKTRIQRAHYLVQCVCVLCAFVLYADVPLCYRYCHQSWLPKHTKESKSMLSTVNL